MDKTKREILRLASLSVICSNLYLLNKEAKGEGQYSRLYSLKNAVLRLLRKRKLAKVLGYHIVGSYMKYNSYMGYTETHNLKANLYEIKDELEEMWTFHNIKERATGSCLGGLDGEGGAYSKEKDRVQGESDQELLRLLIA